MSKIRELWNVIRQDAAEIGGHLVEFAHMYPIFAGFVGAFLVFEVVLTVCMLVVGPLP